MAISELDTKRYERVVGAFVDARRPAPHIRPELDLGYRVTGQSVEIFEIRPVWKGAPGEKMERPLAKATYVKSRNIWRIFWQRADLRWHSYKPNAEVESLEQVLEIVGRDDHACFFG